MKITSKDYVKGLYKNGFWFQIPKSFFKYLTPAQAVLLSYLLNLSDKGFEDDDGWMRVNRSRLECVFGFDRDTQWRLLRVLVKKKLIEITQDPLTRTRKIRLEYDRILRRFLPVASSNETNVSECDSEVSRTTSVKSVALVREVSRTASVKSVALVREVSRTLAAKKTQENVLEKKKEKKIDNSLENAENSESEFVSSEVNPSHENFEEDLSFEISWSKYLQRSIFKGSKFLPSIEGWEKEFKLLQNLNKVDPDRISRILKWHRDYYSDKYMPEISNAQEFRNKFTKILDHKKKNQMERVHEEDQIPLELNKSMKYILGELQLHEWKMGNDQLEKVIFDSWNNYAPWFERCFEKSKTHRSKRFREELYPLFTSVLSKPTHFIVWWFLEIHAKNKDWADWNGDLRKKVVDPKSQMFHALGCNISRKYCHEDRCWHDYLAYLEE